MALTFGSLFAGIGGFDLGFERAGMQCRWQVENDPFANRVLAKHWPNVRRWPDVRTFPPEFCGGCGATDEDRRCVGCRADFVADWRVDVICGGFPCQDISAAGLKSGLGGQRSGLFFDAVRVVRQLRPRIVVLENVAAILVRGHDEVLAEMASLGYDAEWEVLSACSFGAPHSRERMFYVFHAHGCQLRASGATEDQAASAILHFSRTGVPRPLESWWATEPEPCSVVYGVPGVVDRLRGFGNAVVPQVAEWIGRRIVAALG